MESDYSKTDDFNAVNELYSKRVIFLDKAVTEASISELTAKIILLNLEDKSGKKPIYLLINSTGGDMYSAWGLIDIMKASRSPVYTACIGSAMSAACLILMCGAKRYATPHSRLMFHVHWSSYEESLTYHQLKTEAKENEDMYASTLALLQKTTGLTKHKLETMLQQDVWLSVEEAKNINLIDEIGFDFYSSLGK